MAPTTLPYPSHHAFVSAVRDSTAAHFASRSLAVREEYPHILAHGSDWHANIMLDEVYKYIQAEVVAGKAKLRPRFALNSQKHYGTSSQALLFNLIGPLITRNDLAPLRVACEHAGIPWPADARASFEIEDPDLFHEYHGQPTSIDLVVRSAANDSGGLFIEAKFVESRFGGCSVYAKGNCATDGKNPLADLNQCYLHGLDMRYWHLLETHRLITEAQRSASPCMLNIHYQFYRELLFAIAQGGLFVLLYDGRNPVFMGGKKPIMPTLIAQLPLAWRNHVKTITFQEVLAAIVESGRHDDWIGTFRAKYAMA